MARKNRSLLSLSFPQGEQDSQFWEQLKTLDEIGEQLEENSQGLQITLQVNGEETFVPFIRFNKVIPETKS